MIGDTFDDDVVLDWICDFDSDPSLDNILVALELASEPPEIEESRLCLAAVMLLAMSAEACERGIISKATLQYVQQTTETKPHLVELASSSLQSLVNDSALRDHMAKSPTSEQAWLTSIGVLHARLHEMSS